MARYSVQSRGRIFEKGHGFLSFVKNMSETIGINKNVSGKWSQKLLDHTKKSVTDALKTVSKKAIQKTAEETGDLTGNKIVDRITKVPKTSPKNS